MINTTTENIILQTDRLILRYQIHSDIQALTDIWTNTEATKFMGGPRGQDFLFKEFTTTANDPYAEKFDLWVVLEKSTGDVVGHCGYIPKEIEDKIEIDLSYVFNPKVWGKGYATEMALALKEYAFENLKVNRITALVHPNNQPSIHVAEKIGMRFEKRLQRSENEIRDMFVVEK